jgi:hypothetical protein
MHVYNFCPQDKIWLVHKFWFLFHFLPHFLPLQYKIFTRTISFGFPLGGCEQAAEIRATTPLAHRSALARMAHARMLVHSIPGK